MISTRLWLTGFMIGSALFAAEVQPPVLRLDGSIVPQQYRLDLTIVPDRETFGGTIEIDVRLSRSTSVIWLNGSGLEMTNATIRTAAGAEQRAKSVGPDKDFVGLQTDTAVPAGTATLRIEYSGKFRRHGLAGLLTREDSGDWYAYTDFEPLDARTAFPCFDEPIYKAPWQITLHVPSGLKAFSNAPAVSESPARGGLKTVRFRPTQPISTYLVAFAVGPFDVVDAGSAGKKRTPLRIIVPKGRGDRTTFAREATPKIFEALENYFGIPYPFDKLDQIAFPYNAGAMENAGLITYGQTFLVAPPSGDSAARQRNTASVIAHEISHQWFGNLTTMRWWDDLWLNEAFASWIEAGIVHEVFPEWKFLVTRQSRKAAALSQDSLTSARRIRQPVENAGDIGQAFDGITYSKGSSVITMFENFIGADKFRSGVQAYLRKHAWKNTTALDFLTSLSASAGRDVTMPFSTFLDRAGAPLLRVNLQCNGKTPAVSITQERLLPAGSTGERKQAWQVPVCLRYPTGSATITECALLTDPKQTIALRNARSCPAWINADADGTGYYRVLYEGDLGAKLADAGVLTLEERVNVVLNVQTLFSAGLIGPEQALPLAMRFASSDDHQIAGAAINIFGSARTLVKEDQQSAFERLVGQTFADKARRLGWTAAASENDDTKLLRSLLLPTVLMWGREKDFDAQARSLTIKWLADRKSLDPLLARGIVNSAATKGDKELFTALRAAAEELTDVTERAVATTSLAAVVDPQMAREALEWVLTTNRPPNERMGVLFGIGAKPETAHIMWEFIKQNYSRLVERLPELPSIDRGALVIGMVGGLCTEASRKEVHAFFADRSKNLSGGPRALAQALERIDLCVARRTAQQGAMTRYLSGQF